MGTALGIASLAMGAASAITEGNAKAEAAGHAAQQAVYAEQAANINANNTDAWYRDDLRRTLGNISAIRASAGVDPDSPTGQAIADQQTSISDQQRIAKDVSIRAQAQQDAQDAQFYQAAASTYAGNGILKAGTGVLDGLSQSSWFNSMVKSGFG